MGHSQLTAFCDKFLALVLVRLIDDAEPGPRSPGWPWASIMSLKQPFCRRLNHVNPSHLGQALLMRSQGQATTQAAIPSVPGNLCAQQRSPAHALLAQQTPDKTHTDIR